MKFDTLVESIIVESDRMSTTHPDVLIPSDIVKLSKSGMLDNTSYRNDTSPSYSFGKVVNEDDEREYKLFVEHEDSEMREFSEWSRFTILKWDEDEGSYIDEVLNTDNIKDVLKFIKKNT